MSVTMLFFIECKKDGKWVRIEQASTSNLKAIGELLDESETELTEDLEKNSPISKLMEDEENKREGYRYSGNRWHWLMYDKVKLKKESDFEVDVLRRNTKQKFQTTFLSLLEEEAKKYGSENLRIIFGG